MIPKCNLLLVGKDPNPRLIAEASKVDGISVTGKVPDVRVYIDQATLVIDPRFKPTGILNNVLQSMSMGKAVVTRHSALFAIDGTSHGTNIVCVSNENDFLSKISYLLQEPHERARIGKNARDLILSRYTWENIIPKYETMYRNAVRCS